MISAQLVGKNIHSAVGRSGVRFDFLHHRGNNYSCWTPSPEEIALINAGHPIWLVQTGNYIPEQTMVVGSQDMVMPARALEEQLTGDTEMAEIEQVVARHKKDLWWGRVIVRGTLALLAAAALWGLFG